MTRRPVVIDCDPGVDDAIALLLALASPEEIDLLGITCVAGNVPLEATVHNALRIVALAGRSDVAVYAGCDRPLKRPLPTAVRRHGRTGLDGYRGPEPTQPAAVGHAVDFIVEACRAAAEGAITLCPIGPMTNVATAIVEAPEIVPKLREIAFMGGAALVPGYITPVAEFNIHTDPDAARIVLECGVPLAMFGLDVTQKALTTPERLAAIRSVGTHAAEVAADILGVSGRSDPARYGGPGWPLHDPCVIACLLRPALFGGKDCHVAVETESALTLGQTVADWWGVTGSAANCRVITKIDADGYYALIRERLARLP